MRWVVATFNVKHCTMAGKDTQVDLDATAAACAELRADILGLQELDNGCGRSGRVDQSAMLAGHLKCQMMPAFGHTGTNADGSVFTFDNALLSRFPIEGEMRLLDGKSEPRSCFVGQTGGLSVVTTHLSTDKDVSRAQFLQALSFAMDLPSPRVLLGDLNRTKCEISAAISAAGFASAGWMPTFPRRFSYRKIDHVLYRDDLHVSRRQVRRFPVSDHRALAVEIETKSLLP